MSIFSKANPTWLNRDVIREHFSTMPHGSVHKAEGFGDVENRYNTIESTAIFMTSMLDYVDVNGEWIDRFIDENVLLEELKAHMQNLHGNPDELEMDDTLEDNLMFNCHKREYGERGNFMLHHPCLISVMYPSTRWHIHETNLRYWLKVSALRKAYLEKDVDAYLLMIERPYRVPEFVRWCLHDQQKNNANPSEYTEHCNLSKEKYWEVVRWLWTDTENVYEHFVPWMALILDHDAKDIRLMMDKEDRETFDHLPDEFYVYRGGEHEHMSWTLSKQKAEWFRDRYEGFRDCKLFEKSIKKDEVLAYINARDEAEIILRPPAETFADFCIEEQFRITKA
tara:strand:- start:9554 stop:10567 length:1014 start_codon:yes stop_codon:yes gene_type:complete